MTAQDYYNLGKNSYNNGKFLKAIEYFSKVEDINDTYPSVSYFKGLCLVKLNKYKDAIDSFTKVEKNSENNKYPDVSYNKGILFEKLNQYEDAIESLIKAEKDSENNKYPDASYNKGILLEELNRYGDAIKSYTKAEKDSENNKYPDASHNKARLFEELNRYEEAIESFTKVEKDSENNKSPDSSHSKGILLAKLNRYEDAIESFNKTEEDSENHEYPIASCNKGILLEGLERYEEAIDSYTKAEKDTKNQKYPVASYGKGISLVNLSRHKDAINSFQKAINDSENSDYPEAFVELSKCYIALGQYKKASTTIFNELYRYNRNHLVIQLVLDNFSTGVTLPFYSNRIHYLELDFADFVEKKESNKEQFKVYLKNLIKLQYEEKKSLFIDLLKIEDVAFNTETISYQERLKLSYLIHFINNEPHLVYKTIDTLLDSKFSLDEMDYYFYLRSSYLIGEPRQELDYFLTILFDKTTKFGNAYSILLNDLQVAMEHIRYIDPYLLDCPLIKKPISDDFQNDTYHKWINEALRLIHSQEAEYNIPITDNQLKGMSTQLFENALVKLDVNNYKTNQAYYNVLRSIEGDETKIINYAVLIQNIREAMADNVPFDLVLVKLCGRYHNEKDVNQKHNLNIAQAALLLSYHVDQLKKPFLPKSSVEIPMASILKILGDNLLTGLLGISATMLFSFGFGAAVSIITKMSFIAIANRDKKAIDDKFDQLLLEIIT